MLILEILQLNQGEKTKTLQNRKSFKTPKTLKNQIKKKKLEFSRLYVRYLPIGVRMRPILIQKSKSKIILNKSVSVTSVVVF
jgi:hypothetical protein